MAAIFTHLVVRKLVQEAAFIDVLCLENDISVATSTSCRDNVLQKRGGDEENDDEQIDNCADGAGAFRNLPLVGLGHVDTLQACLDEVGTGPHDQRICRREGKATQGNGGDDGRALADSLVEDGGACSRDGVQRDGLGIAERRRDGGGGHVERWVGGWTLTMGHALSMSSSSTDFTLR